MQSSHKGVHHDQLLEFIPLRASPTEMVDKTEELTEWLPPKVYPLALSQIRPKCKKMKVKYGIYTKKL